MAGLSTTLPNPPPTTPPVLGCDVGKDSITIFDTASAMYRTVPNTPKDIKAFVKKQGRGVLLICEATGGHETALLQAASAAGLQAVRADPGKASAYVRSFRSHGKTDRIDARALARYGEERGHFLPCWQPPSEAQQALAKLVRFRADLVSDRADHIRRLKAPGDGPDKRHIEATIEALSQRIALVEADIEHYRHQDRHLEQVTAIIEAIPGCGAKTAIVLAALMPELGQLNRSQAAALAGLAPHPKQSGRSDHYRRIKGGRREIRTAMFMAALAASRYNPILKAHYQQLIGRGKKPIVALTAVARKLITIINARIRDALFPQHEQLC